MALKDNTEQVSKNSYLGDNKCRIKIEKMSNVH